MDGAGEVGTFRRVGIDSAAQPSNVGLTGNEVARGRKVYIKL